VGAVQGGHAERIRVIFDFSRGRQALLSVAQPALGALLALQGPPTLRVLALGLGAAAAGYLAVFSLNDLLDRDVDREALRRETTQGGAPAFDLDVAFLRHPLARGDLSLAAAAAWVAALGLLSFGLAFALRPLCAALFLVCVALEVLYCALKRKTWLKTVPAGVMVGLGGAIGWLAVGPLAPGTLAVGLLMAFWEIFGRNLSNDMADLSSDGPLGITTLATTHGPQVTARVVLAGSVVTPLIALLQTGAPVLRLLLAVTAVWSMTLPALRLRRSPEATEAQRFFNRASLYPVLAAAAAAILLVP
jgi:4-hydroxybenzoate polyprenyltransferase